MCLQEEKRFEVFPVFIILSPMVVKCSARDAGQDKPSVVVSGGGGCMPSSPLSDIAWRDPRNGKMQRERQRRALAA